MASNIFYNEEIKLKFLSYYTKISQDTYTRIFKESFKLEEELNKDLCDFSGGEIKRYLRKLKPTTKNSSRSNGRKVKNYIEWAIEEGYSTNEFNPIGELESPSWFDQFIVHKKQYISKMELERIEALCKNYQDRVILRLLFEGVQGKGCSELIYLKVDDIDRIRGVLRLKDEDGSRRELKVSSDCMEIIEEAIKEKIYYKKNGEMESTLDNVREYNDLVQNDYVIRNCIVHTNNYEFVKKHTIYRRIATIQEYIHKHDPELVHVLTAKSIANSGMIYEGSKIYEQKGKLEKEDYDWIVEKFNIKNNWLLRDFVNERMIEELYISVKC
jgi:integrase